MFENTDTNMNVIFLKIRPKKKTKKCQPAAGDTPDLIKTECVPNSGLARPIKKINRTKKLKVKIHYTPSPRGGGFPARLQVRNVQQSPDRGGGFPARLQVMNVQLYTDIFLKIHKKNKRKKCQPAAGDTPDLIKTECVPNSGLARPNKKINRRRKKRKKIKSNYTLSPRGGGFPARFQVTNVQLYLIRGGGLPASLQVTNVQLYKDVKITAQWLEDRIVTAGKGNITEVRTQQVAKSWSLTNKQLNKCAHSMYGNINSKTLKIMEWNLGSRFWIRKQAMIQATVDEHDPDIMFITESNVFSKDEEHCLLIDRYKIIKLLTWDYPQLMYARIILLIKPEINYTLLDKHMESDTSAIWIKVSRQGQRNIVIGGLYREHQFLKQIDDSSADLKCQEDRWRRMIQKWTAVTTGYDSVVVGDMNLDHLSWQNPEHAHKYMTELVKTEIETQGFTK